MVYREKNELRRMNKEERMKPLLDYDLSLVPYFVRKPKKGQGVKEVLWRVYREEENNKVLSNLTVNKIFIKIGFVFRKRFW